MVGASGRLGRLVVSTVAASEDLQLVAAVTRAGSSLLGIDVGRLAGVDELGVVLSAPSDGLSSAEVVIDVSLPEGTRALLEQLEGRSLVTGVTGIEPEDEVLLVEVTGRSAVLRAANFSTGVHVLVDAVARSARALPNHDVEIVEAHHRHKVDSPSGTALLLARAVAEARGWRLEDHLIHGRAGRTGIRGQQIAVHALRGGDVVGEHTVWLAGDGDRLLLGHVATSRQAFAAGAVRAARWLSGRPAGAYTMRQVLGLDPP